MPCYRKVPCGRRKLKRVVRDVCSQPRPVAPVSPVSPVDSGYDPNYDVYCGMDGCYPGRGLGAPWAQEPPPAPLLSPEQLFWYRMSTLGPYQFAPPGCPGFGAPVSYPYWGGPPVFRGAPCYGPDCHGCPHCNVHVHNHIKTGETE